RDLSAKMPQEIIHGRQGQEPPTPGPSGGGRRSAPRRRQPLRAQAQRIRRGEEATEGRVQSDPTGASRGIGEEPARRSRRLNPEGPRRPPPRVTGRPAGAASSPVLGDGPIASMMTRNSEQVISASLGS